MISFFPALGYNTVHWKFSRGIAKLVKAQGFDPCMRRFESFFPCHSFCNARRQACSTDCRQVHNGMRYTLCDF